MLGGEVLKDREKWTFETRNTGSGRSRSDEGGSMGEGNRRLNFRGPSQGGGLALARTWSVYCGYASRQLTSCD